MNLVWGLLLLIASYAIQALTAKKPEGAKPSQLSDFSFPQHDEGTPQTVIFGDCWIDDWMVLYYGNLRNQAIKQKSRKKK